LGCADAADLPVSTLEFVLKRYPSVEQMQRVAQRIWSRAPSLQDPAARAKVLRLAGNMVPGARRAVERNPNLGLATPDDARNKEAPAG
jgi:hypothetical protein